MELVADLLLLFVVMVVVTQPIASKANVVQLANWDVMESVVRVVNVVIIKIAVVNLKHAAVASAFRHHVEIVVDFAK